MADLTCVAIRVLVLSPAREAIRAAGQDPAAIPFTGVAALASHVGSALFLIWPAGIASLALVLFARRRALPVALAWAGASLALALGYPTLRQDLLRRFYTAAELAAVLVAVVSLAAWVRRERTLPSFAQSVALLILVAEVGSLFVGAWRWGLFFEAWLLSQAAYAALFAILVVLQGGALWNIKLSSRSQ